MAGQARRRSPGAARRKVVATMNVFDFAIEMEEESRAYYEQLAAAAKSESLQRVFTLLAESEERHLEHLVLLKAGTPPVTAESKLLEHARGFIHDFVEGINASDVMKGDADGFRHAVRSEEKSIELYEKLAAQESNAAAAELLRTLASEERHHLEVMENIYDFVESPRTFLEWGEFSNLKEY